MLGALYGLLAAKHFAAREVDALPHLTDPIDATTHYLALSNGPPNLPQPPRESNHVGESTSGGRPDGRAVIFAALHYSMRK